MNLQDKINYANSIDLIDETIYVNRVPYPQANSVNLIFNVIHSACNTVNLVEELRALYRIHQRQVSYYCNACIYLGFLYKNNDIYIGTELGYHFSNQGELNNKNKLFVEQCLRIPSIRNSYLLFIGNNNIYNSEIADELLRNKIFL